MRALLGLVLGLLVTGGGILRASSENSFLKVGSIYYVWAARDSPVPFQDTHSGAGSTATLKILQYGTNQWYWVEFDEYHFPPEKTAAVTIYKKRRWINFAQALAVELGGETDYASTYPQGFKIVPYDGLGP